MKDRLYKQQSLQRNLTVFIKMSSSDFYRPMRSMLSFTIRNIFKKNLMLSVMFDSTSVI